VIWGGLGAEQPEQEIRDECRDDYHGGCHDAYHDDYEVNNSRSAFIMISTSS
jgi:hypothetical protein